MPASQFSSPHSVDDNTSTPSIPSETSNPMAPSIRPVAQVAPVSTTAPIASTAPTGTFSVSPQESIKRLEISPFLLQFSVSVGTDISTEDQRAALVGLTDVFLSEYFALLFGNPQSGATLDFCMVGSNGTPLLGDKSISLEFKGVALFKPGIMPTVSEFNILLEQAFERESNRDYMNQLKALPNSNVFSSSTLVLFNPYHELENAVEGEPTGAQGEGSTEDSSKMSVIAILAIVVGAVLLVALAFVLYRRRACSSEEKEIDSVTVAEEHKLAEDVLGPPIPEDDNDYSVSSSGSIKRAGYGFKGPQVFENDE
jgi:hypothetical protein